MPHLLASNREYSHINRPHRLTGTCLHHQNSLCLHPVLTCPGGSTSGRSTRRKFPSCRINFLPSSTSTKQTWFGSLWTTLSSITVLKRRVSISLYLPQALIVTISSPLILSDFCHFLFTFFSGAFDEHGLLQCAQRRRNQPGAGFTLFT